MDARDMFSMGKWTIGDHWSNRVYTEHMGKRFLIAEFELRSTRGDNEALEAHMNGHLCAAAPDLLAVAEWVLDWLDNAYADNVPVALPGEKELKAATQAAIKKARGE